MHAATVVHFATGTMNDMARVKAAQRFRALHLLSSTVPLHVARRVEQSVYSAWHKQQCDYNAKVVQLAYNLHVNSEMLLRKYAVETLPFLTDEVLAEGTEVEEWTRMHEKKLADQQKMVYDEAKFEEGEQLNFSSLICNRCHSRSISIQQQQIRSADEGMTVFCTCNKCHIRWRM